MLLLLIIIIIIIRMDLSQGSKLDDHHYYNYFGCAVWCIFNQGYLVKYGHVLLIHCWLFDTVVHVAGQVAAAAPRDGHGALGLSVRRHQCAQLCRHLP